VRAWGLIVILCVGACGPLRTDTDGIRTVATGSVSPRPFEKASLVSVQPLSGDRSLPGSGRIDVVEPVDITLGAEPSWVLAAPHPDGLAVLAIMDDGQPTGFVWNGEEAIALPVAGEPGPAPPVARFDRFGIELIVPDPGSPAPATVTDSATWWTSSDGSLAATGAEPSETGIPDGRIVVATDGTVAALIEPTGRYPHGVLGDAIEAAGVAILEQDGSRRAAITVTEVVEGISPLWADLDGDGTDEVLVTASTSTEGAALVAYRADGSLLAAGPAIGRGSRWRHQIGTYRTADGTTFVVAVRTPHLGGVAEFYRLRDGALTLEATRGGVTSHVIGSRNLDLALLADADGDGTPELAAPSQDRTALRGIAFDGDEAEIVWEVPMPGRLVSNLAGTTDDGGLWLVAGIEGGVVRIWPPS